MSRRLTFEEKQSRLQDKRLRIDPYVIEIKSLGDIIFTLFFGSNKIATQRFDKRFNSFVKQHTGSARSIEDTYIIAKEYFPDITYEQVYLAVESLYSFGLNSHWCYVVNRRVHTTWSFKTLTEVNNYLDKFNHNYHLKETVELI